MNWFLLKERIAYRKKALGRHGLHSPFAYKLVEDLQKQSKQLSLPEKLENILGRDTIIPIDLHAPMNLNHMASGKILLFQSIHQNPENKMRWQNWKQAPEVKMSIDFFEIGLLLFREEFKVKQDFVLRF